MPFYKEKPFVLASISSKIPFWLLFVSQKCEGGRSMRFHRLSNWPRLTHVWFTDANTSRPRGPPKRAFPWKKGILRKVTAVFSSPIPLFAVSGSKHAIYAVSGRGGQARRKAAFCPRKQRLRICPSYRFQSRGDSTFDSLGKSDDIEELYSKGLEKRGKRHTKQKGEKKGLKEREREILDSFFCYLKHKKGRKKNSPLIRRMSYRSPPHKFVL